MSNQLIHLIKRTIIIVVCFAICLYFVILIHQFKQVESYFPISLNKGIHYLGINRI